mmetsp:Transcript_54278/g.118755  ORF Transcript_54278/g.118755 Transcript_54278/m.118755 type:complete len:166 (-) Transcript_54278:257-754(-)
MPATTGRLGERQDHRSKSHGVTALDGAFDEPTPPNTVLEDPGLASTKDSSLKIRPADSSPKAEDSRTEPTAGDFPIRCPVAEAPMPPREEEPTELLRKATEAGDDARVNAWTVTAPPSSVKSARSSASLTSLGNTLQYSGGVVCAFITMASALYLVYAASQVIAD